MNYIKRKTMLYQTKVEYGNFAMNHVKGCSHGCTYPCYAMMLAKRWGQVEDYSEWIQPRIVENALELLQKEIPQYRDRIQRVHLCFTTDPFMYHQEEVIELSLQIISHLSEAKIPCSTLTKGVMPEELVGFEEENEYGITLVSLDEEFRKRYEPYAANVEERVASLRRLHEKGLKTWVSIEPYPTPNILDQELNGILQKIAFVDKIIFGRLNYNPSVKKYRDYLKFYNEAADEVEDFCRERGKEWLIKKGTRRTK